MDATDLDDPMQTCPYERSHRILKSRMQYHLVRCRKNYLCDKSEMKSCPYDATHVINEIEYNFHVHNCSRSASVVQFIHTIAPQRNLGVVPLEAVVDLQVPFEQEDWNNDLPEKGYDPLQEARNKGVSIPEVGLSKAKKKQFKNAERLRIQSLENNGVVFNPAPRNKKKERKVADQVKALPKASDDDGWITPLRLPRTKQVTASKQSSNYSASSCGASTKGAYGGVSARIK